MISSLFFFFQKAASILREDCAFYTGTDPTLKALNENMIIFRDPDTEDEQKVNQLIIH